MLDRIICMEYLKKLNMICFSMMELKQLFKADYLNKAFLEMKSMGYSFEDLKVDKRKIEEIASGVVSKNIKNKEDIEIFASLTSCVEFYNSENSKICFVLKNNININKIAIQNLEDLKNVAEERTLTDYAIWSKGGLRQFQLKQYRDELTTTKLLNFIREKLHKYGNDLGEVNLLIMLQGRNGGKVVSLENYQMESLNIDYYEINKNIKKLNLKFTGQILISYNEENKFNVINQVHPKVKTTRKAIDPNYLAGKDLYN